jgi:hypothetical protein
MNFYDTDRMIRKQQNYEKSRAYDIIGSLKARDLSDQEILSCIDMMILLDAEDQSETQIKALFIAKQIVINYLEQELIDAKNLITTSSFTSSTIGSSKSI